MQPMHQSYGSPLPMDEQLRRSLQFQAFHFVPLLHLDWVRLFIDYFQFELLLLQQRELCVRYYTGPTGTSDDCN